MRDIALGINRIDYAVSSLDRMARIDLEKSHFWYKQAAEWALSDNQPIKAINYLQFAIESSYITEDQKKGIKEKKLILQEQVLEDDALLSFCEERLNEEDLLNFPKRCLYAFLDNKAINPIKTIAERLPQNQKNLSLHETLVQVFLGMNDLEAAKKSAQIVMKIEHNNIAFLRLLAQIYEWNEEPQEALNTWARVYEKTHNENDFKNVHRLVVGLFDYVSLEKMLEFHIVRRPDDIESLELLSDIKYKQGLLNESLSYLDEIEILVDDKERIIEKKLSILHESKQLTKGIDLGEYAVTKYPHNENIAKKLIELYHDNYEFAKAFKSLGNLIKSKKMNDERLVLLFIELAIYNQQPEKAIHYILNILNHSDHEKYAEFYNTKMIDKIFQIPLSEDVKTEFIVALITYWQKTNNQKVLTSAFRFVSNSKNQEIKKIFIDFIRDKRNSLNNDSMFLYFAIDYFFALKDYSSAQHYIDHLLKEYPSDLKGYEYLLWVSIEQKDTNAVESRLELLLTKIQGQHNQAMVLASAFNFLGYYRQAQFWFEKFIIANHDLKSIKSDQDLSWLYDLSFYLDKNGQMSDAFKIRHFLYVHLEKKFSKKEYPLSLRESSLLVSLRLVHSTVDDSYQLLTEHNSEINQHLFSEEVNSDNPWKSKEYTRQLQQWYASINDIASAKYFHSQAQFLSSEYRAKSNTQNNKMTLESYRKDLKERKHFEDKQRIDNAAFSLAFKKKHELLEDLTVLDQQSTINGFIQGAFFSNQPLLAREKALAVMKNPNYSHALKQQVAETLTLGSMEFPRYIKTQVNNQDIGQINIIGLHQEYANFQNGWLYNVSGGYKELQSQYHQFGHLEFDEFFFKLNNYWRSNHLCQPSVGAGAVNRHDGWLAQVDFGLNCKEEMKLWGLDELIVSSHLNELAYHGEFFRLFGKQHRIHLQTTLDNWLGFNTQLQTNWQKYYLGDDVSVGSGSNIRVPLLKGRESLEFLLEGFYQKNRLDREFLSLQEFDLTEQISITDFLVDEYDQFSAGFRYGFDLSELVTSNSGSSYPFQINVKTNYSTSEDDPSLEIGGYIGTKIIGRDELRLSADYASRVNKINNRGGSSISLSYIKNY